MGRIEKTVFLSYRRTNAAWALAIFHNLTHHGYDVFLDFSGIAAGDFERVILENIRARAHFIVLLTPSALERCGETGDWLRREIETALSTQRNILPLMLEGFDFASPGIANQLTGSLAPLKQYNALRVPAEYFDEAMDRLRQKYLNVPLDTVLHPASASAGQAARKEQVGASAAPGVKPKELTAQEWFELGFNAIDHDEEVRTYSEAIRLKPNFAEAFNNRGLALWEKGDLEGALRDYEEAIRLKPDLAEALNGRGNVRRNKGDLAGALRDFEEAIRLKPNLAVAYNGLGNIRSDRGDLDGALRDYEEALRLKPDLAAAFAGRGKVRRNKGDLGGALRDYEEAMRLKPDMAEAFNGRANVRWGRGDLEGALRDFQEAIRLKPNLAEAFVGKGLVRWTKGDVEGALQAYAEALVLDPGLATCYYNRAVILRKQGQRAAAIADFQRYLDLGGGARDGDTAVVEGFIRDLRAKL